MKIFDFINAIDTKYFNVNFSVFNGKNIEILVTENKVSAIEIVDTGWSEVWTDCEIPENGEIWKVERRWNYINNKFEVPKRPELLYIPEAPEE